MPVRWTQHTWSTAHWGANRISKNYQRFAYRPAEGKPVRCRDAGRTLRVVLDGEITSVRPASPLVAVFWGALILVGTWVLLLTRADHMFIARTKSASIALDYVRPLMWMYRIFCVHHSTARAWFALMFAR